MSATALMQENTFLLHLFVWPRRFCYRSTAEEKMFGSAMLLRTSSGGGTGLPPVGRAWATALPAGRVASHCCGLKNMFCYSTDSRRPSFITRCFSVSSCGLLPPFVPPGGGRSAVAFLPPPCAHTALKVCGCKGASPPKGGTAVIHFLYGCLPPLLTSGCSHPINQPPPFLTSGCGFQGIFHFLSATATISASP